MKNIIVPIILFAVVITATAADIIYIKKSVELLCVPVVAAKECAVQGDSEGCSRYIDVFLEEYDRREKTLSMLVRHDELDTMRSDVVRIREYSASGELKLAAAELAHIEQRIIHIYITERISAENIV